MEKWPKILPELTPEKQLISNEFMQHWHIQLANNARYKMLEKFNHGYAVKHSSKDFLTTLEIGAGLGEHLAYEKLNDAQKKNYIALDIRKNMLDEITKSHPYVKTCLADCQKRIDFEDHYFDRVLAIHVLEHLSDLPSAIKEIYRLCNKERGHFSVVIPCEGGFFYSIARRISAQRIFERMYKESYSWFIEREHINKPDEILTELNHYFYMTQSSFFPFFFRSVNLNLCIGVTLRPREHPII